MTQFTHYTIKTMLAEPDDDLELTPAQWKKIGKSMHAHMEAELERAFWGGYAPPIDPSTVVAEQTPGQRRISPSRRGTV